MTVTFEVSDVEKGDVSELCSRKTSLKFAAQAQLGDKTRFEDVPNADIYGGYRHGFHETVCSAFRKHLPLTFSPDHIMLCLYQTLGNEVNRRPEDYRSLFVEHQGQKELEIFRDEFGPPGTKNDWKGCIPEFEAMINGDLHNDVRGVMSVDYTTTQAMDRVCRGAALMNTMKAYFSYTVHTRCGIPTITLEGTTEDWVAAKQSAARICDWIGGRAQRDQEEFETWKPRLMGMFDQFIETSQGKTDVDWWKSFYKYNSQSGMDSVNGHFVLLCPWDTMMKTWNLGQRGSNTFGNGLVSVPFKWIFDRNLIPLKFVAGFWGSVISDGSLRPYTDMVVAHDDAPNASDAPENSRACSYHGFIAHA